MKKIFALAFVPGILSAMAFSVVPSFASDSKVAQAPATQKSVEKASKRAEKRAAKLNKKAAKRACHKSKA